jgi:nicotinamidase-related amidase
MASRDRVTPADVPRSPVVLLLVDFINPLTFDGAELLAPAAVEAAKACVALRRRARDQGIQTIFANDNYGVWHSDFRDVWRACRDGKPAAAKIAGWLKPHQADFTILKPRHSAFYATPLALLLSQLRCKRLIVAGLATDNCVLFTAMDAYLHGYALWVPEDCTAAESAEAKQGALAHMKRVLKAETRPAGDVPGKS